MDHIEIKTVNKDTQKALAKLFNDIIQVEYSMILNYPRMIDRLIMLDGIDDEQLNHDLERLGKDSTRHMGRLGEMIIQLGGKPVWEMEIVDRLVDVEKALKEQLSREKAARLLYLEAKHVIERNTEKVTVRDLFGRFVKMEDSLPIDVVDIIDILDHVERLIIDERDHIKIVEDSIATLEMLMNK